MPTQYNENDIKYLFAELNKKNYSNFLKNILLNHLEHNLKKENKFEKYIQQYKEIKKTIKKKTKKQKKNIQVGKYSIILKEKTENFKKSISYSGIENLKNMIMQNVESTKKSFQSDFEEVNTESIFIFITILFFIVYFILKYY